MFSNPKQGKEKATASAAEQQELTVEQALIHAIHAKDIVSVKNAAPYCDLNFRVLNQQLIPGKWMEISEYAKAHDAEEIATYLERQSRTQLTEEKDHIISVIRESDISKFQTLLDTTKFLTSHSWLYIICHVIKKDKNAFVKLIIKDVPDILSISRNGKNILHQAAQSMAPKSFDSICRRKPSLILEAYYDGTNIIDLARQYPHPIIQIIIWKILKEIRDFDPILRPNGILHIFSDGFHDVYYSPTREDIGKARELLEQMYQHKLSFPHIFSATLPSPSLATKIQQPSAASAIAPDNIQPITKSSQMEVLSQLQKKFYKLQCQWFEVNKLEYAKMQAPQFEHRVNAPRQPENRLPVYANKTP